MPITLPYPIEEDAFFKRGLAKGLEKGVIKGVATEKIDVIVKGKELGLSIDQMAKLTNLSKDEVLAIILKHQKI